MILASPRHLSSSIIVGALLRAAAGPGAKMPDFLRTE
jgi:hypothetical protein